MKTEYSISVRSISLDDYEWISKTREDSFYISADTGQPHITHEAALILVKAIEESVRTHIDILGSIEPLMVDSKEKPHGTSICLAMDIDLYDELSPIFDFIDFIDMDFNIKHYWMSPNTFHLYINASY